MSDSDVTCRQE